MRIEKNTTRLLGRSNGGAGVPTLRLESVIRKEHGFADSASSCFIVLQV
jgi:hypothetical protein